MKRRRLKYKTNHAQILEDALYYEQDGKVIIQDRKVITAKGIFSINKRWFFESTSDIRKVKIEGFLISRLPEFLIEELEVYTPYAVNIIDDFVEL
ncbi:hypothetical protein [Sodalis glossinidius]|uniref:hypothetical protein n=1 Tax=Sodalis glossinidius TaxID=63612 RepID=UPI0005A48D61|nr:hypothetical protein [Sodalis glossinidius]